jgi:hypothetical protein
MRAFSEQSPTKRAAAEKLNTDSPYYRLLTKPSTIQVDFTENPDWESEARKNKLIRFMANPHARWGPLGKAVTKKKRSNNELDSVQNKKQVKFPIDKNFLLIFFYRQNLMKIHHLKKICDNFVFCSVY